MKRSRRNNFIFLILAGFILGLSLATPLAALAQEYTRYEEGFTIIPQECIDPSKGDCGLNSFVQLFVNLANVGLKILPYIAILMMMWAGFNLIQSGGNPEKIQEGKKMIGSVVLGVLIVTILAWAWSYFVVSILTGSANLFPNTPFQREWWGGGEVAQLPEGSGCCVVPELGCSDLTKEECDQIGAASYVAQYFGGGTAFQTFWQGENQFCYQFPAQCDNFKFGCCVPRDTNATTCYNPNDRGCLDYPGTDHDVNNCANLAGRCVTVEGEASTASATGCCVTGNSCSASNNTNCTGTFYPNQNCSQVNDCTSGCCVGGDSCSSGKINCTGSWNPAACNQAPNDDSCLVGCCKVTDGTWNNVKSCYTEITKGQCISQYGAGNVYFSTDSTDCTNYAECVNGCCVSNNSCTSGAVNDSCPDPLNNYNEATTCAANPACVEGCCLFAGATTCTDGILRNNCNGVFYGGNCSSRVQCTTTGCCKDVLNANGACINGYAQAACGGAPNTFWANQTCAAAGCT
ncbi:MAG: hypothetical protein HZC01_02395 [Candidatus Kerfeldbacteria bacterium]|nr:hypothetical protein [Candidatus Kerfeldbacteria bacterium]